MSEARFGGLERLYGQSQLQFLKQVHICVVGIGGVGSWVAEALARSGIGKITLIDLDDVCVTNINRQIHALDNTVGHSKVLAMAERIKLINDQCNVNAVQDFVTPNNVQSHMSAEFDYVIEATDSIKAKASMIYHCKRNKINIITIGGAGGQIDPTQITIGDLAKTTQDPLASKLRNYLRRYHNFSKNPKRRFGIECVYSTEQLRYPQDDGTVCHNKNLSNGSVKLDCNNGFGASVTVTASFGLFAASRVINKLLAKFEAES